MIGSRRGGLRRTLCVHTMASKQATCQIVLEHTNGMFNIPFAWSNRIELMCGRYIAHYSDLMSFEEVRTVTLGYCQFKVTETLSDTRIGILSSLFSTMRIYKIKSTLWSSTETQDMSQAISPRLKHNRILHALAALHHLTKN